MSAYLEAFLYYIDILIQIEDCKYKATSIDDTHGRIATSDTLMVIYAFRLNKIHLSELLQRFVQRRGIATCTFDEYKAVSANTLHIFNVKNRIELLCEHNHLAFIRSKKIASTQGTITINELRLQIPEKHIAILNSTITDEAILSFLTENEWDTINIFSYDSKTIINLDEYILTKPYYFDFNYEFEKMKQNFTNLTFRKQILKKKPYILQTYTTIPEKQIAFLLSNPTTDELHLLNNKGYSYKVISDFNNANELHDYLSNI